MYNPIIVNYYKLMGDFSRNKKSIIIAIVLLAQIGLLLFFKLYFFKKFSDEVLEENLETDSVNDFKENKNNKSYLNNNNAIINSNNLNALTDIITSIIDTTMNITMNNSDANNTKI